MSSLTFADSSDESGEETEAQGEMGERGERGETRSVSGLPTPGERESAEPGMILAEVSEEEAGVHIASLELELERVDAAIGAARQKLVPGC